MSLRKQLFWGIAVIFLLIALGIGALSLRESQAYLRQQLASHAQDTATALSLKLADALAENDRVLADIQVSAVFDRGYFHSIQVISAEGNPLIARRMEQNDMGVPDWFVRFVPLPTAPGQSLLSAGWRQLGRVVVVSHAGFAYQYLWRTCQEFLLVMGLALALALAVTHWFLKYLLKPLAQMEKTASDIAEKRFNPIQPIPKTLELRRVVEAVNSASQRVAQMLEGEARRAEQLMKLVYEDEISGLPNRRSFELHMNQRLNPEHPSSPGMLLVLELDGLADFNRQAGHPAGNRLLAEVGALCGKCLAGVVAFRISGTCFALVSENCAKDSLQDAMLSLLNALGNLGGAPGKAALRAQIGGTPMVTGEGQGLVLSRADLALEVARRGSAPRFHLLNARAEFALGSAQWRNLIEQALTQGAWRFYGQAVCQTQSGVRLHREIFCRLLNQQGDEIPALYAIPMAQRHAFMVRMDQLLIADILERLVAGRQTDDKLAINLAPQTVADGGFQSWLDAKLAALGPGCVTLAFEVSESSCRQHGQAVKGLRDLLHRHGAQLGVDQFGLYPDCGQLIQAILPDYLKLAGGLVQEAMGDAAVSEAIRDMVQIAHALDASVYALHIEDEPSWQALAGLGIDGGQGFHTGRPTAFEA